METEWIVVIILSYVLIGMFLADTFVPDKYDSVWFSVIVMWLPVFILLLALFIVLYIVTRAYRVGLIIKGLLS